MDSSENPDKSGSASEPAEHVVGPLGAAANSNIPTVESPALVPEQGETVEPATAVNPTPVTALVIAQPRFDYTSAGAGGFASSFADARSKARAKFAAFSAAASNLHMPRVSQLAATILIAASVGAIAGSVGTFAVSVAMAPPPAPSPTPQIAETHALKDTVARLTSDLAAMKTAADASIKSATTQITRMSERLERSEKQRLAAAGPALVPPATIPAVQSPVAAATNTGAQTDATGSINRQAAPLGFSKDPSRLPVIPGWVLQNVYDGTAYIQSREGRMEVVVGDMLPDGGKVKEIRRQNGRWVVVTTNGLVVMR